MIEPNSSSSTSSSDRTAPASPSDTVIDIPIIVTTSVDSMPHAGSKEKGDDQGLQVTIEVMDIEHFLVQDDPRLWSSRRKSLILLYVLSSACSILTGENSLTLRFLFEISARLRSLLWPARSRGPSSSPRSLPFNQISTQVINSLLSLYHSSFSFKGSPRCFGPPFQK